METWKLLGLIGLGIAAGAAGLYAYNKKTGKLTQKLAEGFDKIDELKNSGIWNNPPKAENKGECK
jgi:hypothetical protein